MTLPYRTYVVSPLNDNLRLKRHSGQSPGKACAFPGCDYASFTMT